MDITEVDDFKPPVVDLTCEEEQRMDDDLDFALSYCLETEFDEDTVLDDTSNKSVCSKLSKVSKTEGSAVSHSWNSVKVGDKKINKEEDADYMLALQLQKEFAENDGLDSSVCSISNGVSNSSLVQKGKRFKVDEENDADYMLALKLQAELIEENNMNHSTNDISSAKSKALNQSAHLVKKSKQDSSPISIVDHEWEILDPNPNIHSLFLQFNHEYFWGALEGVEVKWSRRMTLCAGVCSYEGRGGLCSVRLSQPLLKYRPRRDLVETLLHEMIHAYLFVTHNNKDHDAHGPEFLKHMYRINKQTGTRITVYHSFHDEVDLHRKHWWKCNGPCQHRSPFFGVVKRAMNRAPSPNDTWWPQHQATCGGTFIKIKEPEGSAQKNNLKRKTNEVTDSKPRLGDIRNFFPTNSPANKENQKGGNGESLLRQPGVPNIHTMSSSEACNKTVSDVSSVVPFSGKGYVLGSSVSGNKATGIVGSPFRNNAVLLKSKATKVSFPGAKFPKLPPHRIAVQSPPQRKTKNAENRVQKKPPLRDQSVTKHAGSANTSSNKIGTFGTALRSASGSGSRTIVMPKNPKVAHKEKTAATENSSSLPAVAFKGKGVVLGGGSKVKKEGSKPLNGGVSLPSTSAIKKENINKSSSGIAFPKASTNERNIKFIKSEKVESRLKETLNERNIKSEKVESPFLKNEFGGSQSKIKFSSVSPEGKSSIVKSENSSAVNSNAPANVKCPVCGSMVRDFAVNAHLDTCLQKFS